MVANKPVKRILGIDEAGRGPVIGPMVICGLLTDEKTEKILEELGVRDSKELAPIEREYLAGKIKELTQYLLVKVSPAQIDKGNLDEIEAKSAVEIVKLLKPDKTYIDAPGRGGKHFSALIERFGGDISKMVIENKLDKTSPIVGAASILAKVARDAEIKKLYEEYGIFGSGYPNRRTRRFLEELYRRDRKFPNWVRKKWRTAKEIEKKFSDQGVQ